MVGPDGFVRYETVRIPMARETAVLQSLIFTPPAGLRTKDAVSESVSSQEVLTSIILFGVIYLLLGAVWVFVLNHKIQTGPSALEPGGRNLREVVTARADHRRSLTEAKES